MPEYDSAAIVWNGVGQQPAASVSQLTDPSISTRGRSVAVLRIVNTSAQSNAPKIKDVPNL